MLKSKVNLNAKPISVIENIANGSIVINSTEVMRDIIRKFPTEPYLVRIYADLLLKHEMAEEAAKVYNSAERFVFFLKLSASRPAKRLKKSVIW